MKKLVMLFLSFSLFAFADTEAKDKMAGNDKPVTHAPKKDEKKKDEKKPEHKKDEKKPEHK